VKHGERKSLAAAWFGSQWASGRGSKSVNLQEREEVRRKGTQLGGVRRKDCEWGYATHSTGKTGGTASHTKQRTKDRLVRTCRGGGVWEQLCVRPKREGSSRGNSKRRKRRGRSGREGRVALGGKEQWVPFKKGGREPEKAYAKRPRSKGSGQGNGGVGGGSRRKKKKGD